MDMSELVKVAPTGSTNNSSTMDNFGKMLLDTGNDYTEDIEGDARAAIGNVDIAGMLTSDAPAEFRSNYDGQVDNILDKVGNMNYEDKYADESANYIDAIKGSSYESSYSTDIQQLLDGLQSSEFNYDLESDESYQTAKGVAQRQVFEEMGSRGILPSTITADRLAMATAELAPIFRDQAFDEFTTDQQGKLNLVNTLASLDSAAYGRYSDEINKNFKLSEYYNNLSQQDYGQFIDEVNMMYKEAEFINAMDFQDYTKFNDSLDREYQQDIFAFEKEKAELVNQRNETNDAWDRVEQMGFVDNESSVLLGVDPGTLSKSAREAAQAKIDAMELQQQQLSNSLYLAQKKYDQSVALIEQKETYDSLNDPQTIIENATPEQLSSYNTIRSNWLSPDNQITGGSPQDAMDYFVKVESSVIDLVGPSLAKVLKNEMQALATESQYTAPEPEATYTVDEKINADITAMRTPSAAYPKGMDAGQIAAELNSDPYYETLYGHDELIALIDSLGDSYKYNPTYVE